MLGGGRSDRLFRDEAEARAWIAGLADEWLGSGKVQVKAGDMALGTWLRIWLHELGITAKRGSSGAGRSPKTLHEYRKKVELYIMPRLGFVRLTELTPDHIIDLRRWMSGALVLDDIKMDSEPQGPPQPHVSARTINATHTILAAALQVAVEQRRLTWNPAKAVRHLAVERESVGVALSLADWQRAMDLALDRLDRGGIMVLLAGGMGMRRGETLGVKWLNVYLDGNTPWLECGESIQQVTGQGVITTPGKNAWSRRQIAIPAFVADALRKLHDPTRYGYVVTPDGLHDPGRVESAAWHPIRAEIGWPHLRLHDLRHTLITHLEQEYDLNEVAIKQMIGHAPTGVTQRIYTHINQTGVIPSSIVVADRINQLYHRR